MAMFYALMALCLSGSALGQIVSKGTCPRIQLPTKIDYPKLMGRWYEIEKLFTTFELQARCTTVDYSAGVKNNTFKVTDSYISKITGERVTFVPIIHVPDPKNKPASQRIKYPLSVPGAISNQYILGTDHETFIIIYSCTEWGKHNLVYLWIMTRERDPDQQVLNRAYRVLAKNKISRANTYKVDQDDCDEDEDCSDEE